MIIKYEDVFKKFILFIIFLLPFDMVKLFGYSYIYFVGILFISSFVFLNFKLYIDKKIFSILLLYFFMNMISLIYTEYFTVSFIHNIKLLYYR